MRTGKVKPFVFTKGDTSASVSGPSSEIASTMKPLPLRASYMRWRCGISAMHGLHHVAQNEMTIGPLPTYCESETWLPSMSVSVKSVTFAPDVSSPVPPPPPPPPPPAPPPLFGPPPPPVLGPHAATGTMQ